MVSGLVFLWDKLRLSHQLHNKLFFRVKTTSGSVVGSESPSLTDQTNNNHMKPAKNQTESLYFFTIKLFVVD